MRAQPQYRTGIATSREPFNDERESRGDLRSDQRSGLLTLRQSILLGLGLTLPGLVSCTSSGGNASATSAGVVGDSGGGNKEVQPPGGSRNSGPSKNCVDPKPITTTSGVDTGFVRCAGEVILRLKAVDPDPSFSGAVCDGKNENGDCKTSAECMEKAHGVCMPYRSMPGGMEGCSCIYPCGDDADCGTGRVCVPPEAATGGDRGVSRCVDAQCKTGVDCESGDCVLSQYFTGCGTEEILACRDEGASCKSNLDCSDGKDCSIERETGKWECQGMSCVVGRPFFVSGELRVAELDDRPEWCTVNRGNGAESRSWQSDDNQAIDLETRALAAAHWLKIGQMEHASVASFSRFALALLSLGAPPELLTLTAQASLDEIEHAKLAFALAQRWSGRAVGPSGLKLGHLALGDELDQIVYDLIVEGCAGETCAVAQAQSALAGCVDRDTRALLERIVEDEGRHAQLAWRSLAWMLESFGHPVFEALASAVVRMELEASSAMRATSGAAVFGGGNERHRAGELARIGVISPREMAHACNEAIVTVVLPCARALLRRASSQFAIDAKASHQAPGGSGHDQEAGSRQRPVVLDALGDRFGAGLI